MYFGFPGLTASCLEAVLTFCCTLHWPSSVCAWGGRGTWIDTFIVLLGGGGVWFVLLSGMGPRGCLWAERENSVLVSQRILFVFVRKISLLLGKWQAIVRWNIRNAYVHCVTKIVNFWTVHGVYQCLKRNESSKSQCITCTARVRTGLRIVFLQNFRARRKHL